MKPILPKDRKSQLTVFILLGLVLVLVVAFAFLAREKPAPDTVPTGGGESLKLFVESCLKIATLDAMHEHGLDPAISTPLITAYVTNHMPSCLNNFNTFREEGLEVTAGEMAVDATITDEALTVDLEYPITLRDGDSVTQFEGASYQFPRKIMTTIKPDAETVVTSQDKRILLIIPPGTEATLDGEPLERVGIEVLDREFDGNSNSVLAGMLAFAGIPHGATFSKPVTLIHFYDNRDVPSTIPEENVRLGFWSAELGVWVGLPTTVDAEQNILTATTTHFSPYGAVLRCTEGDTTVFNMPALMREDCYPCEEGWSNTHAPHDSMGLFIQSADITKGAGIPDPVGGTLETCTGPLYFEADPVADCDECSGRCDTCTTVDGSSVCPCQLPYFAYDNANFKGSVLVTIKFDESGGSCIWSEEGREAPNFGLKGTDGYDENGEYEIIIESLCDEESGDTCTFGAGGFAQSTLNFLFEMENGIVEPDACLRGGATVTFNGFGVEVVDLDTNAYYPCTIEEQQGKMLMPCIGCDVNEVQESVCICYDEDADQTPEQCQWTKVEEEEEDSGDSQSPGGPGGPGTVTSGDDTDADSRRERDRCPEGDKEPQEYDTCPDDFESTYKDKRFTFKGSDDTRDMNFCDLAGGDYPEMHHTDKVQYSADTELLVFGSALRKGRCWLLVEVQQCLESTNELPDMYIEFDTEKAEDWVPVDYPYAKCPEDFLENYLNRMFVFAGEKEDTRSKKFCDNYGDYPEMHYTDEWEFANDTQLLVKDSVQRGTRCWLLVQAQSAIKAPEEKPEFYMEFGSAGEWSPAEGYAGCPPEGLGYDNAYVGCDFPGEYHCEGGGGGTILSQICCGSGESGLLYSKSCTEGCDEETGKCTEDI